MVARISLVAGQIDRAIDVDRKVGVDLDQAVVIALVPVVAAPRLVGDVLDSERFAGRKLYVGQCPAAAFGNRAIEDALQPVLRDDELLPVGVEAFDERAVARQQPRQLLERRREERFRVHRRHRVVQRL